MHDAEAKEDEAEEEQEENAVPKVISDAEILDPDFADEEPVTETEIKQAGQSIPGKVQELLERAKEDGETV